MINTTAGGRGGCAFLITTGSRHRPNYFLILSRHPIQSRRYQPVIRSERSHVANREGGLQQRKKFQDINSYLQFVTNQPRYVQPAQNEGRIGSVELYNWFIQIGELLNVPHGNLSLYSHLYEGEPSMREHPCTLHETHIFAAGLDPVANSSCYCRLRLTAAFSIHPPYASNVEEMRCCKVMHLSWGSGRAGGFKSAADMERRRHARCSCVESYATDDVVSWYIHARFTSNTWALLIRLAINCTTERRFRCLRPPLCFGRTRGKGKPAGGNNRPRQYISCDARLTHDRVMRISTYCPPPENGLCYRKPSSSFVWPP